MDIHSPYPLEIFRLSGIMYGRQRVDRNLCQTFWGSHGCMKTRWHKSPFHMCGCHHWILVPREIPKHLIDLYDYDFGIDKDGYTWGVYH
jgi:hypothetical protein